MSNGGCHVLVTFAWLMVVAGAMIARPVGAQEPSVADGIYTLGQADRGEVLYDEQCVACHGSINQLTPDMAALLADHTFRARWEQRSIGELFDLIQVEMPQDNPGSLTDNQVAELLAFILRGNRRPEGEQLLSSDSEVLGTIPFAPGP